MRKQQEINRAVAILCKKGDRISVAQAEVLREKRSEKQVFQEYVLSVGEEKKDKLFRLFLNKEKYSPFSTLFRRIRKNSIR